jgi:hypothetical protein
MTNIYRYDNLTNRKEIYQDPIGGYRLPIKMKCKGQRGFMFL